MDRLRLVAEQLHGSFCTADVASRILDLTTGATNAPSHRLGARISEHHDSIPDTTTRRVPNQTGELLLELNQTRLERGQPRHLTIDAVLRATPLLAHTFSGSDQFPELHSQVGDLDRDRFANPAVFGDVVSCGFESLAQVAELSLEDDDVGTRSIASTPRTVVVSRSHFAATEDDGPHDRSDHRENQLRLHLSRAPFQRLRWLAQERTPSLVDSR